MSDQDMGTFKGSEIVGAKMSKESLLELNKRILKTLLTSSKFKLFCLSEDQKSDFIKLLISLGGMDNYNLLNRVIMKSLDFDYLYINEAEMWHGYSSHVFENSENTEFSAGFIMSLLDSSEVIISESKKEEDKTYQKDELNLDAYKDFMRGL